MNASKGLRSPAVLVFRDKGTLLFSNASARSVLDDSILEAGDLQALCARLFPGQRDHDRAASILRRALSAQGITAGEGFRAAFTGRGGCEQEGIFHVISWRERDGEARAMLSCVSCREPRAATQTPSGQAMPLESMGDLMARIHDLLDVALTVGRVGFDAGGVSAVESQDLLRRLELARDMLEGVAVGA